MIGAGIEKREYERYRALGRIPAISGSELHPANHPSRCRSFPVVLRWDALQWPAFETSRFPSKR